VEKNLATNQQKTRWKVYFKQLYNPKLKQKSRKYCKQLLIQDWAQQQINAKIE